MSKHEYSPVKTLYGPTRGVNFLQFSPDGRYLASGSEDGFLHIFDYKSDLSTSKLAIYCRYPVSAIDWDGSTVDTFFVGFANGRVVQVILPEVTGTIYGGLIWTDPQGNRVDCLAYHTKRKLLAVAAGNQISLIRQDSAKLFTTAQILPDPESIFLGNDRLKPVPRSLQYLPNGWLIVTYLEHGIVCWCSESKQAKWSLSPRAYRIGRSISCLNTGLVVASNLFDGFDAYSLKSRQHYRSYPCTVKRNVPLPCLLIDGGSSLLVGSSVGKASILDTQSVALVQDLVHEDADCLIQALAYCVVNGVRFIATAPSDRGKDTTIRIWRADQRTSSRRYGAGLLRFSKFFYIHPNGPLHRYARIGLKFAGHYAKYIGLLIIFLLVVPWCITVAPAETKVTGTTDILSLDFLSFDFYRERWILVLRLFWAWIRFAASVVVSKILRALEGCVHGLQRWVDLDM